MKYFHEMTEHEFKKLGRKKWSEIAEEYTGPLWCKMQDEAVDGFGCWSLISFKDGKSLVTGEDFCKECDLYNPDWGKDV